LAGYPPPTLPVRQHIKGKNWNDRANRFAEYYIALMVPWSIETKRPLVSLNYEGLCQWMQQNDQTTNCLISKCRNLSIDIKATCLRVDTIKKLIMNIWRGRCATKWKDVVNQTIDGINYEDGIDYRCDLSDHELDVLIEFLRNLSGADDTSPNDQDMCKLYIQHQMMAMETLFPVILSDKISFIHDNTFPIYDPILSANYSTLQQIA
jgi:hypothetical protein